MRCRRTSVETVFLYGVTANWLFQKIGGPSLGVRILIPTLHSSPYNKKSWYIGVYIGALILGGSQIPCTMYHIPYALHPSSKGYETVHDLHEYLYPHLHLYRYPLKGTPFRESTRLRNCSWRASAMVEAIELKAPAAFSETTPTCHQARKLCRGQDICVCTQTFSYTYTYTYACVYVCTHACMYICIYRCIHIYISANPDWRVGHLGGLTSPFSPSNTLMPFLRPKPLDPPWTPHQTPWTPPRQPWTFWKPPGPPRQPWNRWTPRPRLWPCTRPLDACLLNSFC